MSEKKLKLLHFLPLAFIASYFLASPFNNWLVAIPIAFFYTFASTGLLVLHETAKMRNNPQCWAFFLAATFMVALSVVCLELAKNF